MAEAAEGLSVPDEDAGIEVLLNSAGGILFDYNFLVLTNEQDQLVHVIAVAYIGDQLLVAVPKAAWHKKRASRRLPVTALKKAVTVEVVLSGPDSMEEKQDAAITLWMGFLDQALVAELEVWDEESIWTFPIAFWMPNLPCVFHLQVA